MPDSHSGTHLRRAVLWTVALALAGVSLWYSLQGIDWRHAWAILSHTRAGPLSIAAMLAMTTLFLRACRWRVLLNSDADVSVADTFWPTAAGYFGNNFLPARAGELIRTVFVTMRAGLDYPFVLATAVVERITDALALTGIAVAALLHGPVQPTWLAGAARSMAILAVIGAVLIATLPLSGSRLRPIIGVLPVSARWRGAADAALTQALRGFGALHDVRPLAAFLGLTVIVWCGDAAATVATAAALGLHMPVAAAFLLLAALGLSSALPSTPGYVGIFQFVSVTVLVPFGFTRTDAITYILASQALNFAIIGFWGGIALWRYRHALRRPGGSSPRGGSAPGRSSPTRH